MHIEVPDLVDHRVRVHLAHILTAIAGSDVGDLEVPVLVVVASQGEAGVFGDDGVVDGQDGLRLDEHPGHLRKRE